MDRKKIYFLITGVIFGLSICLVGCNAASPSSNTDNKDSSPDLIIRNGRKQSPMISKVTKNGFAMAGYLLKSVQSNIARTSNW